LDAVNRGIESDRAARSQRATLEGLRARYATLTPRENQVMTLVVSGILNKHDLVIGAAGVVAVGHLGQQLASAGF
jgi:FixJ family two-component response regulator